MSSLPKEDEKEVRFIENRSSTKQLLPRRYCALQVFISGSRCLDASLLKSFPITFPLLNRILIAFSYRKVAAKRELTEICPELYINQMYSKMFSGSSELLKTCLMFRFSSFGEHIKSLEVLTEHRLFA